MVNNPKRIEMKEEIVKFIERMRDLIKNEFKAKEVILFGSFVKSGYQRGSDIDILVIMNTDLKPYKQASLIRMRLHEELGTKYPIDIIVRTPEEVQRRVKLGDFFLKKVLEEGLHL